MTVTLSVCAEAKEAMLRVVTSRAARKMNTLQHRGREGGSRTIRSLGPRWVGSGGEATDNDRGRIL
jgi:hypothetical protein